MGNHLYTPEGRIFLERHKQESVDSSCKTILLVNLPGAGKSSLYNFLVSRDAQQTDSGGDCVTKVPVVYPSFIHPLKVIDTPGLGDEEVPLGAWVTQALNLSGNKLYAVVLVVNSAVRVGFELILYTAVMKRILASKAPRRILFVLKRAA